MVSLDVVFLFTKILVDLATEIARKQLKSYSNEDQQEITNWLGKEI